MGTASAPRPHRLSGRLFLALGWLVLVSGLVGYAAQIQASHLTTPWYLPITGTVAFVLIAAALWKRRSAWRIVALIVALLLAVAEWGFLLGSAAPPYTGPLVVGQPFPAFATVRADGTPFTQRDLEGEQDSVLVSFRGRW